MLYKKYTFILILIGISLIILLAPFYRGLFFEEEQLIVHIISFTLFALWGITRLWIKGMPLFQTPLDFLILALVFFYLLSFWGAVNPRSALSEILTHFNYLAIYLMIADICRHSRLDIKPLPTKTAEENKEENNFSFLSPVNIVLHVLLLAGVAVALEGFGSAATIPGLWEVEGAFRAERMQFIKSLQYSNTAAAYLMAAYLLCLTLTTRIPKEVPSALYLPPAIVLLIPLLLSSSRATLVLLPVLFIALIVVSLPGNRLRVTMYGLITILLASGAAYTINPILNGDQPQTAWLWMLLAASLSLPLGVMANRLGRWFLIQKPRRRKFLGFGAVGALIVLLVITLVGSNFSFAALSPSEILEEPSVQTRLHHYEDALQMISDYPLGGSGGDGYNELYYMYHEKDHQTTEVHNHYLQTWVEAGFFAFLSFLGIWIALIWGFIKARSSPHLSTGRKTVWICAFIPALALGIHSAFDFNLSLPAVTLFLFALLAIARSQEQEHLYFTSTRLKRRPFSTLPWSWLPGVTVIVLGVALSIYCFTLFSGYQAHRQANEHLAGNEPYLAASQLNIAIDRDPLRAENYFLMGQIKEFRAEYENNPTCYQLALDKYRQAYQLRSFNPEYTIKYGELLLYFSKFDKGMEKYHRLLHLRPHWEESYRKVANVYFQMFEYYQLQNMYMAQNYLENTLELKKELEEKSLNPEEIYFQLGRACFHLGKHSQAHYFLKNVEEKTPDYSEAETYLQKLKNLGIK